MWGDGHEPVLRLVQEWKDVLEPFEHMKIEIVHNEKYGKCNYSERNHYKSTRTPHDDSLKMLAKGVICT